VKLVVVVLAAVPMFAGSCGRGSTAPGPADNSYLSELHNSAPDIGTYRSDTQLVRLGHAACDGFAAGASYETVADRLALQEGHPALPSQDLGAVITAAADNYCIKFRAKVS
jgi:hypothetical protein